MSEKNWFIMKGDQISGPFTKSHAENELSSDSNALIWSKGMKEWLSLTEWQDFKNNPQTKESSQTDNNWKYKLGSEVKGPMSYPDLIATLKVISRFENIQVWSSTLNEWKNVFSLPEVADQIGVTRRKHPRVPIMGQLEAEFSTKEKKMFRVITISQGGIGLSNAQSLKLGDKFKGIINSANLSITIQCECEVKYAREDGYIGIAFGYLGAEALSCIIEYVNRFEDLS